MFPKYVTGKNHYLSEDLFRDTKIGLKYAQESSFEGLKRPSNELISKISTATFIIDVKRRGFVKMGLKRNDTEQASMDAGGYIEKKLLGMIPYRI